MTPPSPSTGSPRPTPRRAPARLWVTLATVCALWVLSDAGYYVVLPWLGFSPSYNHDPAAAALYYLYWIGVAVILLWPTLATWSDHACWPSFSSAPVAIALWTLLLAAAVAYVAHVLPALPRFDAAGRLSPPDMPQANAWYFLPKSVDILFQQILIAALVLGLANARVPLRRMAVLCGLLFGLTHLLLLLGGSPVGYTVRFTGFATLFGLVFPVLFLRVPNGFALSYAAQWAFYAGAVAFARLW
ncbi:MAG: hypothetical protein ACK414_08815 [Gemmobacter sp.]